MSLIVTFYSYKGGVGRTMALANIAVLLSKIGRRVLAIDWDLEAPGLDRYFREYLSPFASNKPGLLDFFLSARELSENSKELTWKDCLTTINVNDKYPISFIGSGKRGDGRYVSRVLDFDWRDFFSEYSGGEYIENLRNEWREEFDIILIDSRTGITDIGGICTIQIPDVIIPVFTANSQSIEGTKDVVERAQKARQNLAYDREQLLILPLLSRFDSRAEYAESQKWLNFSAESLVNFYDWLPKAYTSYDLLEQTKLPHIAHFSFGEKLPAIEQSSTDPEGLSYAYQKTAELLAYEFSEDVIYRISSRTNVSHSEKDTLELKKRSLSDKEIRKIKEELVRNPKTVSRQLGKFNITIGHGSEIRIGEKISRTFDASSLNALVLAIKEANESTNGKVYQYLQSFPLETIEVSMGTIDKINSDLEFFRSLDCQGFLTDIQRVMFSTLNQEVHALNEFNRRLEELHHATSSLIEETRLNLIQKIEKLRKKGGSLLSSKTLKDKEWEAKANELRILEDFLMELEDSEKVANWIDATRKNIAMRYGREALKEFPEIQNNASPEKVSDFCFSIYQFLAQIAHCLKWGTRDILDSPEISLVFDYTVYERAFILIKYIIGENLPTRFSQESRDLACEYIDYLIFQLPFYE